MTVRVAVCYFGITRSLADTLPTIERNVLAPIEALTGRPAIQCAHLFRETHIDNKRTGEARPLDPDEYRMMTLDHLELEEPDICMEQWDFERLKTFGDAWGTGFGALRNLVHQLHSLDRVTGLALEAGADLTIFARPDLAYHDSLEKPLKRALRSRKPGVWLPWWQAWYGVNDRFAICAGRPAIESYGRRIRLAHSYCESQGPLHSERLLAHALKQQGIPVRRIGARASRVRAGGVVAQEEFTHPVTRKLQRAQAKFARISGLRALHVRLRNIIEKRDP